MKPEVKQRRVALRMVSRRSAKVDESIEARDEAVYDAAEAGASLEEIGDAAGLAIPELEQIINDHRESASAEPAAQPDSAL